MILTATILLIIVINFQNCIPSFTTHRPKLILKNVSWKDFHSICNEKFADLSTNDDISSLTNKFDNLVTDSLIKSGAKLKNDSHRRKDTFCWWWDDDYAKLIYKKTEAYKNWKDSPSLENLTLYENKSNDIRKKLKKLKQSKFQNFSSSLNRNSNISHVWKVINNMVKKKNQLLVPVWAMFQSRSLF